MEGSEYVPDGINNRYIPASYTRPLYYTLRPPHQMDLQTKDKKLPPIFPVNNVHCPDTATLLGIRTVSQYMLEIH